MSKRQAWAFKDAEGNWSLTMVRPGMPWRPANTYENANELAKEAKTRNFDVTWENERD